MNINATLLGQTIMFILFVWFCMKFVWPPIMQALSERKKQIADGLAAGERGKRELELASKVLLRIYVKRSKKQPKSLLKQKNAHPRSSRKQNGSPRKKAIASLLARR